jgi:uncharacterized membrane protein YczE
VPGLVVLQFWVPLRQPLAMGTVVNTVLAGLLVDAALRTLPTPGSLLVRGVFLVVGVVMWAASGAIYLGSHLGPGPRDGLMTGLVSRTGRGLMRAALISGTPAHLHGRQEIPQAELLGVGAAPRCRGQPG